MHILLKKQSMRSKKLNGKRANQRRGTAIVCPPPVFNIITTSYELPNFQAS